MNNLHPGVDQPTGSRNERVPEGPRLNTRAKIDSSRASLLSSLREKDFYLKTRIKYKIPPHFADFCPRFLNVPDPMRAYYERAQTIRTGPASGSAYRQPSTHPTNGRAPERNPRLPNWGASRRASGTGLKPQDYPSAEEARAGRQGSPNRNQARQASPITIDLSSPEPEETGSRQLRPEDFSLKRVKKELPAPSGEDGAPQDAPNQGNRPDNGV